jgi:Transmembrane secretion effector
MVTVEYRVLPGREDDLLAALRDARFSRRRTGASAWRVWQDGTEPSRILEKFVVASWQEHLLQQARVTVRDQQRYDAIRAMTDPAHPTTVTHWLTPELRHAGERGANPPVTPRP